MENTIMPGDRLLGNRLAYLWSEPERGDVVIFYYPDNEKELYVGAFKSWVFAVIIVGISCYQGFVTNNGAVGVGLATKRSVVTNFLVVLIVGYIITRLFY